MTSTTEQTRSGRGDALSGLQVAFDRLVKVQLDERRRARQAIIEFLRKTKGDERRAPIDSVAEQTRIGVEEVHLALGSLLSDGIVQFQEGFQLAVDEDKLAAADQHE
ncbi:hypothetical protein [Flindersiella endophytica]